MRGKRKKVDTEDGKDLMLKEAVKKEPALELPYFQRSCYVGS